MFCYDDKRSEIGYYAIKPTLIGDQLCPAPFPRTVYQWHSDGFDLPPGAKLLAVGGLISKPSLSFGLYAVGLQFNPEVT